MRMQHADSLIHFPLAVTWMVVGWWNGWTFESGSDFLHTLLPYLGAAAALLQLYILIRKIIRRRY